MILKPRDIEPMVSAAIASQTVTAAPMPLPPDFDDHLPFALVTATGGQTAAPMNDLHLVSVDVYAATWGAANAAARACVASLRGMVADGTGVYDVDANMPYNNPDPRNQAVPRVSFTATLVVAGEE